MAVDFTNWIMEGMRVAIFGATGMIGRGVLRECLVDPGINGVVTVGRSATGLQNPKLREVVRKDLFGYRDIEDELKGFDACFFCLGVSSVGMAEAQYERMTYGIAMAAAETLARLNPEMTFIYVSGAGTDSTEKGRTMWARVKGKTENAIMRLPFQAAFVFRPAFVQPVHGERSRTAMYRWLYVAMKPLAPAFQRLFPDYFLTTEEIGRAMIQVARRGSAKRILESRDIVECGSTS
jgi:uncharacterized protein YbjT (DUF2867 family)